LFLLVSVIWGSSYLLIKIGLDAGVAPLTLVSLRTILGVSLLAVVMLLQHARVPRSLLAWKYLGVVGLTEITIPFALIAWSEQHISSGMAGILTAMVPLFTVVLASLVLHDEPITPARIVGLLVGFSGVILLALPSLTGSSDVEDGFLAVAGMAGLVLASLSYAIAAVYARHRLSGRPLVVEPDGSTRALSALEISFGQLLVGMVIMTAAAVLFERPAGGVLALPQEQNAIVAILLLGLLGTGVAFLIYFAIIGRWGATRATLIAYVIPIVAIALGFLILDERLRPIELVGAALIIGGVLIVNNRLGQQPLFRKAPSG